VNEDDPAARISALPEEVQRKIALHGMSRSQRRQRGPKHTVALDPVRFKGYDHAVTTAERPWDLKAKNRKKNKAARAARRKSQ
jgi:hypothetical protein